MMALSDVSKSYPEREYASGGIEPGSSHAEIVERISANSSVLDVGCASGYIAAALNRRGCSTYGIEINPSAAEAAKQHCADVAVIDLESQSISTAFPGKTFDYIVFGDVLEHLREPWTVLAASRSLLKPQGRAIVSVPNVAHGAVRLALLSGEFDYRALGILDNTHLRFFTIDSVDELLLRGGFQIVAMGRTKHPVFGDASLLVPAIRREDVDPQLAARVESAPEADTLQFIATARALSDVERESAIFERISVMRNEVATLRRTLGIDLPWEPSREHPTPEGEALLSRSEQLSLALEKERESTLALRKKLADVQLRLDQDQFVRATAHEALKHERDRNDELDAVCTGLRIEMDSVRQALLRTESQLAEANRVIVSKDVELNLDRIRRLRSLWAKLRRKLGRF